MINPDQNTEAANTWFLGNMFMDQYFIINHWQVHVDHGMKPAIGIYDKWHPSNGNWMPSGDHTDSGGGSTDPITPPPEINPENEGGSGAFWPIFLVLFFIVLGAILFKLCGQ